LDVGAGGLNSYHTLKLVLDRHITCVRSNCGPATNEGKRIQPPMSKLHLCFAAVTQSLVEARDSGSSQVPLAELLDRDARPFNNKLSEAQF
jgi:hypothetical protein